MNSFLSARFSAHFIWELLYLLFAIYLLFHPALSFPQSNAVVLGGGLVLFLFRGLPQGALEKLGLFWVLFLLYGLSSTIWSPSPGVTLQASGFLFLGTLLYLMTGRGDPASQNRIEMIVLILALVAASLGIYQWLFGFDQLAQIKPQLSGEDVNIVAAAVYNKRAFGPLVTPGALAALLIFSIPQTLIRGWAAAGFKKILFGLVTLVLLLGLAATGGVGAWVCLAVVLGFIFFRQNADPRAFFVLGLFCFIILGLVWHRGLHSWTLASYSMRVELWQSAWQLFLQHPWLGWGLGTFGEAYQSAGLPLETGALFAHNLFLQLLVETGLAGTILFGIALGSLVLRFKRPSRWEGWGVLGGVLAVFLFSFIDLPFQMAELIWIFAGITGRLELRPSASWKWPEISPKWLPVVLLVVFAITGFWPPFRPWNFALLAVSLWTAFALMESQIEEVKLWVLLGSGYLALRAFNSPSASGAVWFLELTGLLVVFYQLTPRLYQPKRFLTLFAGLGLLWAVKLGWYCWSYVPGSMADWIHFQLVDVTEWIFYPNPKYLAVFLIPLIFILFRKPFLSDKFKIIALSLSILIVLRLKSLSAWVGLGLGWLWNFKNDRRKLFIAGLVVVAGFVFVRSMNSSGTKWGRLEIWLSAIRVWSSSPWVGVGPGVFAGAYHQVQSPRMDGVSRYLMEARYAENEFLDLLVAFGVVGFIFVMVLVWKAFSKMKDRDNQKKMIGLGAASFFDFCLHTPLIALIAVGSSVTEGKPNNRLSGTGGFLVLGLTLGLFGSAVFTPLLEKQAGSLTSMGNYPGAFRYWKEAVALNPWNASLVMGESNFIEQLYLSTKDPNWKNKADESLETAMDLEKADGELIFEKARRWTTRYQVEPSPDNFSAASTAWNDAEKALPLNTYVPFEEGLFWTKAGQISSVSEGVRAAGCYEKSLNLEPNFAPAWANLGLCELQQSSTKEKGIGDLRQALQVYDQWKNAPGLSPEERQMVDLPPQEVEWLRKEVTR